MSEIVVSKINDVLEYSGLTVYGKIGF